MVTYLEKKSKSLPFAGPVANLTTGLKKVDKSLTQGSARPAGCYHAEWPSFSLIRREQYLYKDSISRQYETFFEGSADSVGRYAEQPLGLNKRTSNPQFETRKLSATRSLLSNLELPKLRGILLCIALSLLTQKTAASNDLQTLRCTKCTNGFASRSAPIQKMMGEAGPCSHCKGIGYRCSCIPTRRLWGNTPQIDCNKCKGTGLPTSVRNELHYSEDFEWMRKPDCRRNYALLDDYDLRILWFRGMNIIKMWENPSRTFIERNQKFAPREPTSRLMLNHLCQVQKRDERYSKRTSDLIKQKIGRVRGRTKEEIISEQRPSPQPRGATSLLRPSEADFTYQQRPPSAPRPSKPTSRARFDDLYHQPPTHAASHRRTYDSKPRARVHSQPRSPATRYDSGRNQPSQNEQPQDNLKLMREIMLNQNRLIQEMQHLRDSFQEVRRPQRAVDQESVSSQRTRRSRVDSRYRRSSAHSQTTASQQRRSARRPSADDYSRRQSSPPRRPAPRPKGNGDKWI